LHPKKNRIIIRIVSFIEDRGWLGQSWFEI